MPGRELADLYVAWLAQEMAQRGVDAAALARQAKLNNASVWKILQRKVTPKTATLERLARALGTMLPEVQLVSRAGMTSGASVPPRNHAAVESTRQRDRSQSTGNSRVDDDPRLVAPPKTAPPDAATIRHNVSEPIARHLELLLERDGPVVTAQVILRMAEGAERQQGADVRALVDLARSVLELYGVRKAIDDAERGSGRG